MHKNKLQIFLVLVVTLLPAERTEAASRPSITGTWQLNRDLSTNGRSELPGATDSEKEQRLEAAYIWTAVESDSRVAEVLEATELLEIFREGSEFTMNATGGPQVVLTRTFSTNVRQTKQSFGLFSGISRARWQGSVLEIDTATRKGEIVHEKYETSHDGNLLYVSVQIVDVEWPQPLQINRVYDRVS
jgi:hypothetical protein